MLLRTLSVWCRLRPNRLGRRERVAARKVSATKPATELGDANQGAFVDRSSILRASTISNRQVEKCLYLPFYYLQIPRRIELYAGRGRKENASVTQSGTRFPNGSPGGKPIPESALRLGRSLRMTHQAETASRNPRSERVAFSQRRSKRKAHPVIPPQTGTHFPLHLPPRKTCAPSIPKLGRRKPKRNRRRSI